MIFFDVYFSMRQAYRNIYYGKQSGLPVYMTYFQIFLCKRNWGRHQNNSCVAVNYWNKFFAQDDYWRALFKAIYKLMKVLLNAFTVDTAFEAI